jgi:predicted MFS family arabinose efflux permease
VSIAVADRARSTDRKPAWADAAGVPVDCGTGGLLLSAQTRQIHGTDQNSFTIGMQLLLGTACALLIASLYYAQPLTGLIAESLGMPARSAGLLVTLPLLGYGVGILFLVPLGDILENRRLVLALVGIEALCLLAVSMITHPALFLAVGFVMGAAAGAIQLLVPYVTYIVPEAVRGQAVGKVVSGVMIGILLARPVSSLVTDFWSWRAMFGIAALLIASLVVVLLLALPPRRPAAGLSYLALLRSMGRIFVATELLRRRALYHSCMFGAFIVFWTAAPLWLSGPQFGLTQRGIAWVALAGAAGAVAPPLAEGIADMGFIQKGTMVALACAAGASLLPCFAKDGSWFSIAVIVCTAVILDSAVAAHLVFSQRAIYSLGPEERSRVNALFMATFFGGGAVGSALSGWAYPHLGWIGVAGIGAALPMFALLYFATERRNK